MIILFSFTLTLSLCLPQPRKPDHPFQKSRNWLGLIQWPCLHVVYRFISCGSLERKEVALLCYVVSEEDCAFGIWFCVGCRSAARLMGVTSALYHLGLIHSALAFVKSVSICWVFLSSFFYYKKFHLFIMLWNSMWSFGWLDFLGCFRYLVYEHHAAMVFTL